ncbi:MAG: hypothetical protein J1F05_04155 [Muribaculaceae bacterium]|nr:hypothetical protein [Muribaculaceae bacterium]
MTKKVRHINSVVIGILLSLCGGVVLSGCVDEFGWNDQDVPGEKVRGVISVSLGSSSPVSVSRTVDFNQDAMVKIDSYWVGVFDTKTGELIGSRYEKAPRKDDDTRYTMYNGRTPFTVQDLEIYYYDNNPEAYIAGVVNLNGVAAKLAGETATTPLQDLLADIQSFEEFCKIVVSTESATAANRALGSDESCPLMMGFYKTGTSSVHTTVNSKGSVAQSDSKIRLVSTGDNHSEMQLPNGRIYLQRLVSEMNYTVEAGEGVTIHSLQYMVVNNPLEVYLAEHTTDQNGGTTSDRETYLENTANYADFEGAYVSTGYRYATQVGSDYTFSYQHYENKHWGRKWNFPYDYDQNSHLVREMRYDDSTKEGGKSDVFRTLCQYAENPHNNNASYVVLRAEITVADTTTGSSEGPDYECRETQRAVVYYTIHEGATSRPDGTVNEAESCGYDYQRIRNTQYNYNITIYGVNTIIVHAERKEDAHDDGITGELWRTEIYEFEPGYSWPITATFYSKEELDLLTWRLYYKSPEGEENYGNWKRDDRAPSNFPEWPALKETELNNTILPEPHASEAVVAVSNMPYLGWEVPVPINELNSTSHPEWTYPLYVYISLAPMTNIEFDKADQYRRGFYFCFNDLQTDEDGCCNEYQRVSGFEQSALDMRYVPHIEIVGYDGEYFDIGMTGYESSYNKYYNNNVYRYTPYFERNYYESGGYRANEVCWTGTKETGAYIRFFDNYGFRDTFVVEILDESGEKVELELTANYDDNCIYGGHDAIFLVPIEGEDLQKLSTGYHSVRFTPIGDPSRYKPGGEPYVLEHSLHIIDSPKYNFTTPLHPSTSETMATWFRDGLVNDGAYRVLEYGGLTIVGGRKFSGSNTYIQTGRPGFPYSDQFSARANNLGGYFRVSTYRNGVFKVSARHTGAATSDRRLCLYKPKFRYYGQNGEEVYYNSRYNVVYVNLPDSYDGYIQVGESVPVQSSSTFITYELPTGDVNEVTDFIITTTENILIESIEFIPD